MTEARLVTTRDALIACAVRFVDDELCWCPGWRPNGSDQPHEIQCRQARAALALPAAAPAEGLREALNRLIWNAIGLNEGCPAHYGNLGYSCSCEVGVPALQAALARQGEAELSEFRHHESAGSE